MARFFFLDSVFKHNTGPRSAMLKCNSDPKCPVNCKNISQRVQLNPRLDTVYAEVLQESIVKGIQLQYILLSSKGHPMFEMIVLTCKADTKSVEVRGMGMWACEVNSYQRTFYHGSSSNHAAQTGIPMRSFFFFTVFRPVSRRTSSSSDSSISSSAEKRIWGEKKQERERDIVRPN